MIDELVDGARVAEAHLGLGRVHVDVDAGWVERQEQTVSRVAAAVQHVLISLAQCMGEHLVAHEAAINVAILSVATRPGVGRQCGVASQRQVAGGHLDAARIGEEVVAQNRSGAAAEIGPWQLQRDAAVVCQREGDFQVGQRHALEHLGAMRELGAFALQEFSPSRCVIFFEADMRYVNFFSATITNSKFYSCYLEHSNFAFADVIHCDFSNSILLKSNFEKASLSLCNFTFALLDSISAINCVMIKTDLSKTSIKYSNFSNSNLGMVKLYESSLIGSIFKNSDLNNANLIKTDLFCADFSSCNLENADFTSAICTENDCNAFGRNSGGASGSWKPREEAIVDSINSIALTKRNNTVMPNSKIVKVKSCTEGTNFENAQIKSDWFKFASDKKDSICGSAYIRNTFHIDSTQLNKNEKLYFLKRKLLY